MKRLGMMVLMMAGVGTLLGSNYVLAEGPQHHMRAKAHFEAMDANNDGKINLEEHMAKCENRFKRMDANNDGFVTEEEVMEARRARKARRAKKEKMKETLEEESE